MADEVLEASLVEDELSQADMEISKKTQATALSTLCLLYTSPSPRDRG